MTQLSSLLGGFLGGRRRRREPLTRLVAVWPDGRRYVLRKQGQCWWWSASKGSWPLAGAKESIEHEGGKLIRERIPGRGA
jgi:hypothetical protein